MKRSLLIAVSLLATAFSVSARDGKGSVTVDGMGKFETTLVKEIWGTRTIPARQICEPKDEFYFTNDLTVVRRCRMEQQQRRTQRVLHSNVQCRQSAGAQTGCLIRNPNTGRIRRVNFPREDVQNCRPDNSSTSLFRLRCDVVTFDVRNVTVKVCDIPVQNGEIVTTCPAMRECEMRRTRRVRTVQVCRTEPARTVPHLERTVRQEVEVKVRRAPFSRENTLAVDFELQADEVPSLVSVRNLSAASREAVLVSSETTPQGKAVYVLDIVDPRAVYSAVQSQPSDIMVKRGQFRFLLNGTVTPEALKFGLSLKERNGSEIFRRAQLEDGEFFLQNTVNGDLEVVINLPKVLRRLNQQGQTSYNYRDLRGTRVSGRVDVRMQRIQTLNQDNEVQNRTAKRFDDLQL